MLQAMKRFRHHVYSALHFNSHDASFQATRDIDLTSEARHVALR
jgi:hypothetical protein